MTRACDAFLQACRLDVQVDKPGNVSVRRPGHRMVAQQFIDSAAAAAPALFAPGAGVGQRLLGAVSRTRMAVGCNTNLGILLLIAPLAAALDLLDASGAPHAAEQPHLPRQPVPPLASPLDSPSASRASFDVHAWRRALDTVLDTLSVQDARDAYEAIALAQPAGLGNVDAQSVHGVPTVTLREAMALAAGHDSIARQYAVGYRDLFDTGLSAWQAHGGNRQPENATLGVFMTFLGAWPDSHIVRKFGAALGQSVTNEAREHWSRSALTGLADTAASGASDVRGTLDAWDLDLKARGINPGTSADLTVATAFMALCLAGISARNWHDSC